MKLINRGLVFFVAFLIFFAIPLVPNVSSHSLFNSAEQFQGGYRVQVATLPEFPNIGEKSQILFRVTDQDFNEVDRFVMGIRIFFHDEQIDAIVPQAIEGSHLERDYVFTSPGNHIFRVDLYGMNEPDEILTYTFNMSTQSPFGYIFIIAITIGAMTLGGIVFYIYVPRFLKSRSKP